MERNEWSKRKKRSFLKTTDRLHKLLDLEDTRRTVQNKKKTEVPQRKLLVRYILGAGDKGVKCAI